MKELWVEMKSSNVLVYVRPRDAGHWVVKRLRFEIMEDYADRDPTGFLLEWNSEESRVDPVKVYEESWFLGAEGSSVGLEFERCRAEFRKRKGTRVRHKDSNGFDCRMFGYLKSVDGNGVATVLDGDGVHKSKMYHWDIDDVVYVKHGESWSGMDLSEEE